ncbi:MAG: hypothetical protein WAM42_09470 [Candidatus Nitrosopolaris sp.]
MHNQSNISSQLTSTYAIQTGKDFGDFSDPGKIPLIGPLLASQSRQTGVLHNENGVFVSWKIICQSGQQYLSVSCDSLVNGDGSLTQTGDKAVGCIRNGMMLAAANQKYLHLPFGTQKMIIGALAGMTKARMFPAQVVVASYNIFIINNGLGVTSKFH